MAPQTLAMAPQSSKKFHIAMFPWFAMGHATPYLHLSNELAQRGHKISFLLPNKALLTIQHMNLHPNLITFHPISVPQIDGLPKGTETASDIHISLAGRLGTAFDLTRDQVEATLQSLKPDFVLYDFAYWIPELAPRIGFKTVFYRVICAAAFACWFGSTSELDVPTTDRKRPDYPSSTVILKPHEVSSASFVWEDFGGIKFHQRLLNAGRSCDAIAIRTCRELEGQFCDYMQTQFGKPVLLTGPVLPKQAQSPLEAKWAEWLAGFKPSSVVFCSLGSQWVLDKAQFQELVLGLELTGLPFLAAIKPPTGATTVEEFLPEGFEERVKGRGVVYDGWVQQPQILSHWSVGCFVNVCGFGTMWEALMSDNQIVMIPQLFDQILNARVLAGELKVGVEVEKDEKGRFSKESLCVAIKSAMEEDSEVRVLMKNNHAKFKETLELNMSGYIDKFVEDLHKL